VNISLVVPPRVAPTYVPLGVTLLEAALRQEVPHVHVQVLDLNVQTWHDLAMTNTAATLSLAFYSHDSPSFYDSRMYAEHEPGLAHLQARLRSLGASLSHYVETSQCDAAAEHWLQKQAGAIAATAPDLLALSVVFPAQFVFAVALAKYWRGVAASPIVFGGAYMSALDVDELLLACPFVDAVVNGEGEAAMTALAAGNALPSVPGIVLRDNGGIRHNIACPVPMRKVATPDFRNLPLQLYANPVPVLPVSSSRSCKWRRCRFCAHNASFGRYRTHSVQRFVDELQFHHYSSGARHFYLVDQYMDPVYLELLSDELLHRNLPIHFHVMGRPTVEYTPERLAKAFAAGCRWISWGVETGSQRLLDVVNKGTTPAAIAQVLAAAHQAGISNLMMMIYGLPTTTLADLDETLGLISRVYPHVEALTASVFVLFARTPFAVQHRRYGMEITGREKLFVTAAGAVHSNRLSFRRLGESCVASPVGLQELETWQRRRPWLGPPSFLESLGAEHYLLYAAHRCAELKPILPIQPVNTDALPTAV